MGEAPVWSPDANTIYYLNRETGEVYAVDVNISAGFVKGNPRRINSMNIYSRNYRRYHIHPAGDKFIVIQQESDPENQNILVIQNFFDEIRRLVPGDR